MKFFVDTGDVTEVRTANDWGILDGVTTNPTLIAKTGRQFKEVVLEICDIVHGGAISAEVVAPDFDGMLREAYEIHSWHPNIVVKIPMTKDGMRALKKLHADRVKVNVTLVFSLTQAMIAAKNGATFISNFVGRVDDMSGEGMDAVADTVEMVNTYGFDSEVLVASIRHPLHVVQAIQAGAQISTMPFKVMEQLYYHPLTDLGLERFTSDWEKAGLHIFEPSAVK